jgi:hypothetical protein
MLVPLAIPNNLRGHKVMARGGLALPALMPALSEMPVPMLHEVRLTMVLRSQWSIGSKVHILTDGSDRPAIDNRTIPKVRATANRGGLRECEGTCQSDRGRENDCFEFHCSATPGVRKRTKTIDFGC